ncbi:MAG: nucleotide exchange factor GrpE [Bacillales bacterium]
MSEENGKINKENQEINKNELKKSIKDKINKKDEEIKELKNNVEHWKNEYYKCFADMANLRKNIEKDQVNVYKYRIEGFVSNLLTVLDSFNFAFKNEAKTEEMKNYLIGFNFIYKQLIQILKDEGVSEINPNIGDKFNENDMQAVDVVDSEEDNTIHAVNLKGYKLHDRLIRPAMVVVNKIKTNEVIENTKEIKGE